MPEPAENRRLGRLLREAKLKLSQACVDDIDYPAARRLDRSVIRQLTTGRWVLEHQTVIISGATGTGKTYLACALAQQACRQGFRTLYRRASRLFEEMAWRARTAATCGRSLGSRGSTSSSSTTGA